jgi:hypothetical protein
VKSRVDSDQLAEIGDRSSSSKPAVPESQAPAASGPVELSTSGIANEFFERDRQHGAGDDGETMPPSSRDEPVYLTAEQVARKERSKRLVAAVVGVLVAVVLFAAIRGALVGRSAVEPSPTSDATGPASVPAPAPEPTATLVATAEPIPSASAPEVASAEPSASPEDEEALVEVDDPFQELTQLLNVGRYNKAIPMGKAAIAKDPENGDAYYFLGQAYEELGKREEARALYAECVQKATKGQYLSWCKRKAP